MTGLFDKDWPDSLNLAIANCMNGLLLILIEVASALLLHVLYPAG